MSGGTGTVTGRPPPPDHRPEPGSDAGTAFQRSTSLELAPLPTAISCARGHAINVLAEWGLAHLSDDAVLLVSELMTNALEASAVLPDTPPIALRLLASQTSLVIEAWDRSPLDLEPAEADPGAEHGRGLLRHEALCYIPDSVGRNLEEHSWAIWLTSIRKVRGTIACQRSGGRSQGV
jgi:anti-sigma regulatory factor (Ser/Thr protein kinase)